MPESLTCGGRRHVRAHPLSSALRGRQACLSAVFTSMPNTRLRRCAQVIERRRSAGVRGSAGSGGSGVSSVVFNCGRLPRPEGVSCARNFAFGAKMPWKRVSCARGGGTRAASLAMTNRQDCRFGRPQVARRVAHRDVRHQLDGLELHVRVPFLRHFDA